MKKFAPLVLVAGSLLFLAGCSKPETPAIEKALVDDFGAPAEVASCAADKLHEELGASSLSTLVEDGPGAQIDADDADAYEKIIADCGGELE